MAQLGWLVQARTQMVWLTATLPRVWWPDMTGVGRGPYQWIKSEAVVAFIQDCIRRAAGGKVIIYANIIGQVTAMAWVLGCEAYYSEHPVITTTSALGMGVDIPNICSIIHIRTPRTLLDYAQESGRAGCRRVVLDQYLDRVVDGYQRRYCQDADPGEQICDGEADRKTSSKAGSKTGSEVDRIGGRMGGRRAGQIAGRTAGSEVVIRIASKVV
ncbi:uncharacterized protein P174DRAFT_465317 [Aspergillus novofumigatus IBT 16806]|uniref:Helicase C-terminal domain-containing protein n=1 Tax=Aspergillus novofumigatus (strain IBT 16806) TaxID=1392255 RepID=A0A2I1BS95_ASPN1|nr:uncharacterized protein P174DRAFT_465317 [Aspergillus novofumigatus IBT 16806]PKX88194.1 hypothetical protein P174DRAFT_465317 [Aspergillus novofumigatus IBT 16806]